MSHKDEFVQSLLADARQFIGSYFKKGTTIPDSGLESEVVKELLPPVIGKSDTHPDFWKEVNEFYDNLETEIPAEGLLLNVALMDNSQPVSKSNPPENIMDFIRYNAIKGSPIVAATKTEGDCNSLKRYYIVNEHDEEEEIERKLQLEQQAEEIFYKIKDDESKITEVLNLLGIDTRGLSKIVKIQRIKDEFKKKPVAFIKASNDKLAQKKHFIRKCIRAGILEELKMTIVYKEQGETIGETLEAAAIFLNDKANSALLKTLEAKVKEIENERKLD